MYIGQVHILPYTSTRLYISRCVGWWDICIARCFCKLAATTLPTVFLGNHVLFKQKAVKAQLSVQCCLVPVRRFPSPSWSIHFGDVSEANIFDRTT